MPPPCGPGSSRRDKLKAATIYVRSDGPFTPAVLFLATNLRRSVFPFLTRLAIAGKPAQDAVWRWLLPRCHF